LRSSDIRISSYEQKIKVLDKTITDSPMIPGDVTLFRGANMSWRDGTYKIKREFFDKGFTSTSLSFLRASIFTGGSSKSHRVLYIMYSNDKLTKALWLNTPNEQEVLLPRNSKLKVMKEKISNYGYMIQLIQICKLKCLENISREDVINIFNKYD
jgi:hypothetical protein